MAEKEKLEVQVTTQGADRAARELDNVARKADELDNKKIDIDAGALSGKLGQLAGPAGLAGVALAVGGVADHMADAAIEADNLAALTGDNVETASRLNAVWKQTGADTKDLQDVLLQMNGVLATNADLAQQLGVNLEDGATVGERFEQVSKALDGITDAAKRSQIASQVFGEEGVRQYNALRQAVGDVGVAMENVADGNVFDEEDVEEARKMKRELAEIKANAEGLANTLGKLVLPVVNDIAAGIKGWFDGVGDAGAALGDFVRRGNLDNTHITEQFEDSEQAARDFDRALLDGLDTFDAVRQKVIDLTGDVTAANIVALEWQGSTEQTAAAVADLGDKAANAGPKLGDMAGALDKARVRLADLNEEAKDDALDQLTGAIQRVRDAIDEAFGGLEDDLGELDLFDDIQDQFVKIEEAAKKLGDGGEAATRDYNREVRQLQRQLLELVATRDDLTANEQIEFATRIRQGDLDTLNRVLDELTQDRWINVGVRGNPQQAFSSIGGTFSPTQAAPVINGSNPAPASTGGYVDNRQITNIFPVGSTPTTQYIDSQTDFRRNGNR